MSPNSKPPKAKPRFHGPFIIVKKLDKGDVMGRPQRKSSIWIVLIVLNDTL